MKQILFAIGILLAAVAVYAIGRILPDETIMTLVGVMCGIIASIPLSVLLLVALTRDRSAYVSAPDAAETVNAPDSASGWTVTTPEPQTIDAPRVRQLKP